MDDQFDPAALFVNGPTVMVGLALCRGAKNARGSDLCGIPGKQGGTVKPDLVGLSALPAISLARLYVQLVIQARVDGWAARYPRSSVLTTPGVASSVEQFQQVVAIA
jgi:hypothetical protein